MPVRIRIRRGLLCLLLLLIAAPWAAGSPVAQQVSLESVQDRDRQWHRGQQPDRNQLWPTCWASFPTGTTVTTTATADANSTFTSWSGCDTVSGTSCTITMNAVRSVTASFSLQSLSLSVSKTGTGTGTVTSSPTGINCGATCSASFAAGTMVTLTATLARVSLSPASLHFGSKRTLL